MLMLEWAAVIWDYTVDIVDLAQWKTLKRGRPVYLPPTVRWCWTTPDQPRPRRHGSHRSTTTDALCHVVSVITLCHRYTRRPRGPVRHQQASSVSSGLPDLGFYWGGRLGFRSFLAKCAIVCFSFWKGNMFSAAVQTLTRRHTRDDENYLQCRTMISVLSINANFPIISRLFRARLIVFEQFSVQILHNDLLWCRHLVM